VCYKGAHKDALRALTKSHNKQRGPLVTHYVCYKTYLSLPSVSFRSPRRVPSVVPLPPFTSLYLPLPPEGRNKGGTREEQGRNKGGIRGISGIREAKGAHRKTGQEWHI
jgi:hypothetical protein